MAFQDILTFIEDLRKLQMHLLQSSMFVGELLGWMVIVNHEDAFLKASEEVSRVRYPTLRDYIMANVRAHH